MKKIIISIIMFFPIVVFAGSYKLVNFNQPTCDRTSAYEYSICIKNNVGTDILPNQVLLNEETADNDGGSGGGPISFSIWKADSYLIIEVSKKFFTNGVNRSIKFFLTGKNTLNSLPGCGFVWNYLTPHYSVSPTLMLERNGDDYYCHYQ